MLRQSSRSFSTCKGAFRHNAQRNKEEDQKPVERAGKACFAAGLEQYLDKEAVAGRVAIVRIAPVAIVTP